MGTVGKRVFTIRVKKRKGTGTQLYRPSHGTRGFRGGRFSRYLVVSKLFGEYDDPW